LVGILLVQTNDHSHRKQKTIPHDARKYPHVLVLAVDRTNMCIPSWLNMRQKAAKPVTSIFAAERNFQMWKETADL